jgi:hypothetical protein
VSTTSFHSVFHLPLSVEAFNQFNKLQNSVIDMTNIKLKYSWSFIWGSSTYIPSKAYKSLKSHMQVHRAYKWLWNCCCLVKHEVFFSPFEG